MAGEVLGIHESFEQRQGVYERAQFGRVITAMVTPFDESGALNLDGEQELAVFLVDNGSEGLVLSGTTGESPNTTRREQLDLLRAVREAVEVPILVGTGSASTSLSVEMTSIVTDTGNADGVLVVSPYYDKPAQFGIFDYFSKVAGATDLPLIAYNIPGRTGGKGIEKETLLQLAEVPNIVGVKDATGHNDIAAELAHDAPPDFMIYSGNDAENLTLASYARSVGAISVASHWAGLEIAAMYDAFERGDIKTAEKINKALFRSYEFEGKPELPNPLPAKAMMRHLGLKVGYGRSPMVLSQHDNELLDLEAQRVIRVLELEMAAV